MIKYFLLIQSFLFSGTLVGQPYYGLDHSLKFIENNSEPAYFLAFEQLETGDYSVRLFYSSMEVLMKGKSIDSLGQQLVGLCIYYYKDGTIQSEGSYSKGRKTGIWKRYTSNGSQKADRIYSDLSMETVIFNSALIMPKPHDKTIEFEAFIKEHIINEGAASIIELSPIAIQLVIDREGKVTESRFDERLSLENMNTLDRIIKLIPTWDAGSNGTQKINVRINYSIDFSAP